MNTAFIHSDKGIGALFSLSQIILIMIINIFLLMKYQLVLIRYFVRSEFL